MNRIIRRKEYENEGFGDGAKRVGVLGLSAGAGCTFVAEALAHILAHEGKKAVTFLDGAGYMGSPGRGYTYDALGMEKRFAIRGFADVFEMLEQGKSVRKVRNIDEKINWLLPVPKDTGRRIGEREINRFANIRKAYTAAPGDVIVCDLGTPEAGRNREAFYEILKDMDAVVAVIDPLPSALLAGEKHLQILKSMAETGEQEFFFAVNRANPGVGIHEIRRFLGIKPAAEIKACDLADIYAAEFACTLPIEFAPIRERIAEDARKLAAKIA